MNGSFGYAIEVADIRRRGLLRDDMFVKHLAELGGDKLASIIAMIIDDSAYGCIRSLTYLLVEVGNEFSHDAGHVAFTPDGVDEFEA